MISGTEIAAARQRAGLSQKALADLLGTDIKTVNNWETGRTKPRQVESIRKFVQLHPPEGVAPLSLISDEELLVEIAERFARARAKGDLGDGNNLDQKTPDGGGDQPGTLRPVPDLPPDNSGFTGPPLPNKERRAAESTPGVPSQYERATEDQDAAGEEDQDR